MDIDSHHTLTKTPEDLEQERELEDMRLASLGNSFHCLAFACLLDHALWSFGIKALKRHHTIIQEAEEERRESY